MVKFDDKGQGYWDFILEKFTPETIEIVKNELENFGSDLYGIKIVAVKEDENSVTAILELFGSYHIHTEFTSSTGSFHYLHDEISKTHLRYLMELVNGVDKND